MHTTPLLLLILVSAFALVAANPLVAAREVCGCGSLSYRVPRSLLSESDASIMLIHWWAGVDVDRGSERVIGPDHDSDEVYPNAPEGRYPALSRTVRPSSTRRETLSKDAEVAGGSAATRQLDPFGRPQLPSSSYDSHSHSRLGVASPTDSTWNGTSNCSALAYLFPASRNLASYVLLRPPHCRAIATKLASPSLPALSPESPRPAHCSHQTLTVHYPPIAMIRQAKSRTYAAAIKPQRILFFSTPTSCAATGTPPYSQRMPHQRQSATRQPHGGVGLLTAVHVGSSPLENKRRCVWHDAQRFAVPDPHPAIARRACEARALMHAVRAVVHVVTPTARARCTHAALAAFASSTPTLLQRFAIRITPAAHAAQGFNPPVNNRRSPSKKPRSAKSHGSDSRWTGSYV
ncbi:hypothetical protein DFH06DRAFT_1152048 [Mycena polygramma]|nr:hypothetical protein DFH06DRAFT_1152048 [Mycena polygramma]